MDRSQSEVVGFVLLFGIIILSTVSVLAIGAQFIPVVQDDVETSRAENTMTKFSSEANLVAFGRSESQTISLPRGTSADVNPNSSWIRVQGESPSSTTTFMNASMGDVRYNGIAYEGGGVWRVDGGQMVSPPGYSYREETLTLQIANITGDQSVSRRATIRSQGSEQTFPTAATGNPIQRTKINVTVDSPYYRGWADYFETRLNSEVSVFPDKEQVTATLIPPPEDITANKGVIAKGDLDIDGNPNDRITGGITLGGETDDEGAIKGPIEENSPVTADLTPSTEIISDAQVRLGSEPAPASNSDVDAGTYAVSDDSIFSTDTEFDTTNGDIELLVNDSLKKSSDLDIVGDGTVTIYVDGDIKMNGQPKWGNSSNPGSLKMYGEQLDRITEFYGVLYTSTTDIAGAGSDPDLRGALISTAGNVNMAGNVDIEYDDAVKNQVLTEVQPEFPTVSYLHIGKSRITVSDD